MCRIIGPMDDAPNAFSRFSTPLGRLRFLAWGVGLFAVKIGLDYAVAGYYEQPYSVLYYVSPMDAPLLAPGGRLPYWLTLWAVALPFIGVGMWLTTRRMVDAGLPVWLVLLFFVPFANLIFFAAAAVVPSRKREADPKPPGYREAAPPPATPPPRSVLVAALMAGAAGAAVALGMVAISVGLFEEYGTALFLGAPAISGHLAALLFFRLHSMSAGGSLVATAFALLISGAVMLAFAIEGAICLLMIAPLASMSALFGWGIALAMAHTAKGIRDSVSVAMVLPFFLLAEVVSPLPPDRERPVESVIEIDAPPEVVWPRVIAFPDLPPPEELIFRLGVSAPTGAVIEGEGVGAVRRCQFTTGEFVEPITVWRPGRELSFGVERMPDPMQEMTPWPGPRPPHLDGYLAVRRGQFVLQPLPGGRTRLIGRTWYTLDLAPRGYFAMWADDFIHRIHLRVMRQIATLAEADARQP